jgi:hypothetical protein
MKTHGQSLSHPLAVLKRYAFPVIALALMLLLSSSARAGTTTFNDLTDTLSVSSTNLGASSCGTETVNVPTIGQSFTAEFCNKTLVGPSGATGFTTSDCRPRPNQPTGCFTLIGGANGGVSDFVLVTPFFSSAITGCSPTVASCVQVLFASDAELPGGDGFGLTCSQFSLVGGCGVTENGSLTQLAATIHWTGTTSTDSIEFGSDVEPEPASLLLLGSGLLAMAAFRKKLLA